MKKPYLILFLLSLTATSFSQSYNIYTAKTGGLWSQLSNWTTSPRTDGIKKNKFIIPKNINMIVDNDVDRMGFGDMQIVVEGILTLQPSTNFNLTDNSSIELRNGTLVGLTANQKIKIGNEIKYKGNTDGILTGYFLADNTTGSSPSGFRSLGLLPVNFTSFYVSLSGNSAQLHWSTSNEVNNSHFDVQRSYNGINWETLATVAGANNRNATNNYNYNYNDKNISNPVVYYRLRQVDIDGRAMYSSIKIARIGEATAPVRIYGSDKNVVVDFNQVIKNPINVSIVNSNGQIVSKQVFSNPQYKVIYSLKDVPNGIYIVHVSDNKGLNATQKIAL